MKLGLLGYPVEHSLSPGLYQELLGSKLKTYELFSFKDSADVPSLDFFKQHLNGLNITSPYKKHFVSSKKITFKTEPEVLAINTLAFTKDRFFATNTDYVAIFQILTDYLNQFGELSLLLLGDGVMADLTIQITHKLGISCRQFSRKRNPDFSTLDLRPFSKGHQQTIIINACSREFVFKGQVEGSEVFWDYNYAFEAHQSFLSAKLTYVDGTQMLRIQALEAIRFWETYL